MRTIWKYPLQMRGWNRLPFGPDGKVVLAAIDPDSGAPAIWVDHVVAPDPGNPGAPARPLMDRPTRLFAVVPTGKEIHPTDKHVGSMIDRTYVWHIIEQGD